MSAEEPPQPQDTAPAAGPGDDSAPAADKAPSPYGRLRWRRWLSPLLIVLATIIFLVSALSIWIDYSVLDSEEFGETAGEILADPEIQPVLAGYLVDQIFSSVDIQESLGETLPPPLNRLAGPVAAGIEQVALQTTTRLVQSEEFQTLFANALRIANERFVTVVEGDSNAIATVDGKVILDLRPLTQRVFERLGLPSQVLGQLPAGRGQIVIMDDSKLTAVQTLVNTLQGVANWFWVLALLLYAAAVWLARGRRREALRGVAFSWLLVGLGLLAIVRLGGPRLVETLVVVPDNQAAAQSVWNILTAVLRETGRAIAIIGAIMLVGVWLAGHRAARRRDPRLARPAGRPPAGHAARRRARRSPCSCWRSGPPARTGRSSVSSSRSRSWRSGSRCCAA